MLFMLLIYLKLKGSLVSAMDQLFVVEAFKRVGSRVFIVEKRYEVEKLWDTGNGLIAQF